MLLGIVLGLLAAGCQSLSYLASRWFTAARRGGLVRLLVLGHVVQGAVSLPIVLLLWPEALPPVGRFLPELLGVSGFYMAGQAGLFVALRYTDASRVSPLLGLKIAILAAVTVGVLGDSLAAGQWVAVGVSVLAAFLLNRAGGAIAWPALAALGFTLVGYSLSDLCIRFLLEDLAPVPPLHASVWGAAASYVVCGAASAALLPRYGSRSPGEWAAATPYAVAWLAAMICLFGCFAMVGVVFGNILQATRGILSIVLGAAVARRGHVQIEARVPPSVFWRRLAAACIMTGAIVLFAVSGGDHGSGTRDQGGSDPAGDELPRAGVGGVRPGAAGSGGDVR